METISAIVGGVGVVLSWLFSIPVVGFFIQLAFYGLFGWILYRLYRALPARMRASARQKVGPYTSWLSRPIRWFLVNLLADREWIRQPGDTGPTVVEKEVIVKVPVRMRRTPGQWLFAGVRWGVFYAAFALCILYWEQLRQLLN